MAQQFTHYDAVLDVSVCTWPTAIASIRSGLVEVDAMVTARYPLEETAAALESARVPGDIKSIVEVAQ